jgi:VanZ family protein
MLPRQFMVRQWNDGLLVTHDATVDRDGTKTIKFDVDHVFSLGRLVLVTISSGPKGTTVFLDGEPAASFPRFHISRSELSGQIILGTSPTTYQPWAGDLHGLAIYSKELTAAEALRNHQEWMTPSGHSDLEGALARYTLAEAAGQEMQNEVLSGPSLYIPARFSVPHKPLLQSAAQEFRPNWRYAIDGLINIAGFIPLGLIVCACLGWKRLRFQTIIITTISCGVLSLVIELLQYFVPRRGSGMTDIITNTLGAAIGAMLNNASRVRRGLERLKVIGGT